MSVDAFPLQWPDGWPRSKRQKLSRYKVNYSKALADLRKELRLLGATNIVISSNIQLRRDGMPYAVESRRVIPDPGVAVYFVRAKRQQVIACDSWNKVSDNIRAIGLTVAGLRSVQRAGATELLDRAFTGFKALPAVGETTNNVTSWRSVLGVDGTETDINAVRAAYRNLSRKYHPDRGGDAGAMAMINRAWEQAQSELGG